MAKAKAKKKKDKPSAWELEKQKEHQRELNLKQKDFVREYLLCRNATEAHRRVYGSKNPDVDGPRLLGNAGIQAMIAEEEAAIQKKYEATRDELVSMLTGVVLLDPADIVDQDSDGNTSFKQLRHMPKQARLALEIMGSPKRKSPFISLRSMRKTDAIEQLTKLLGFKDGGSGTGGDARKNAIERLRAYIRKNSK